MMHADSHCTGLVMYTCGSLCHYEADRCKANFASPERERKGEEERNGREGQGGEKACLAH